MITNYLKTNLDADVKIVGVAPVRMRFGPMSPGNRLTPLLAPVGGKVPTGEETLLRV